MLQACTMTNLQLEQTNERLLALQDQIAGSQDSTQSLQAELAQVAEQQQLMGSALIELQLSVSQLGGQQQAMREALKVAQVKVPAYTPVVQAKPSRKVTLGRVEWLWLPQQRRYFAAQLDTVSELSLIFAENIVQFERDGDRWLRFEVERNDWPTVVEAAIRRTEKIGFYGGSSLKGTVVSVPIQLDGFSDDIEFLIVKRKTTYPQVVLGKNYLTDIALVDVSEKYLHKKNPSLMKIEAKAKRAHDESMVEAVAPKDDLPDTKDSEPEAQTKTDSAP